MKNFLNKLVLFFFNKQLSKLNDLYHRHLGEECYIFGDGASIKWMDLSKFSDKISITGNYTVFHKDYEKLNTEYCVLIEPFYFYPWVLYRGGQKRKIIRTYIYSLYKKKMAKLKNIRFFLNISNIPTTFYLKNIQYIFRSYRSLPIKGNPFFERSDCMNGTLKFQLSLAAFLGFKKVYLIGHDYTHRPARSMHFYEKGEGVFSGVSGFCHDYFEYMKKNENVNMEILTVTIDSPGEYLDSVSYTELTGATPEYKENIDIINLSDLNILSTWEGYKIF